MNKWTKIDEKRLEAYTVLVAGGRLKLEDIVERYREEVELRVAERTLEILGDEDV